MTLLWRIFFKVLASASLAVPLCASTITGRVELVSTVKDHSGVVIWLESAVPAPPTPGQHATMTQKHKTFSPHVLAVRTGTTVEFPNFDPIFHNAFSSFDGKVFDIGLYAPGTSRSVRFDSDGVVRVFCNIHASMSAIIVVVNTPWFAATVRNGAFEIAGAPPGNYMLHVYHERATPQDLAALTRSLVVDRDHLELAPFTIPESSYLPAPHKNKYGKEYPPEITYSPRTP